MRLKPPRRERHREGRAGLGHVLYARGRERRRVEVVGEKAARPPSGPLEAALPAGKNGLLVASFGVPQQDAMPYVATYDPTTQTKSTLDGKPVGATIGGGVRTFKIDASGRYVCGP